RATDPRDSHLHASSSIDSLRRLTPGVSTPCSRDTRHAAPHTTPKSGLKIRQLGNRQQPCLDRTGLACKRGLEDCGAVGGANNELTTMRMNNFTCDEQAKSEASVTLPDRGPALERIEECGYGLTRDCPDVCHSQLDELWPSSVQLYVDGVVGRT